MAVAVPTRQRERLTDVQRAERASRRIEWARLSLEAAADDLEAAGEPLATQAREQTEAVGMLARAMAARVPAVRP